MKDDNLQKALTALGEAVIVQVQAAYEEGVAAGEEKFATLWDQLKEDCGEITLTVEQYDQEVEVTMAEFMDSMEEDQGEEEEGAE